MIMREKTAVLIIISLFMFVPFSTGQNQPDRRVISYGRSLFGQTAMWSAIQMGTVCPSGSN